MTPSYRNRSLLVTRATLVATLVATLIACGGGSSVPGANAGDPVSPGPSTPTTISISASSVNLSTIGQTQSVSAEVRDQKGLVMSSAAVTWTSSNSSVASVSSAGVITANGAGGADVIAASGSATASVHVVVSQSVATVVVSPPTITMTAIGSTQQLTASARDAANNTVGGAIVTWSASPSSVASVSTTGTVTAISNGTATISASSQGIIGSSAVTVQAGPTPPSCTGRPVFGEYLIDPAYLKVVTQIGVIGGANTELVGRSYAFAVDGDGVRIPLKAPATMNIVAARHYLPSGAPTSGYVPDWSLVFDAGCGVRIELFHVKDVAASIKAVADTTISSSSGWLQLSTPVPFAAGETFGWYMRGLNSVAFDVIAHDQSTHNRFINQPRYDNGGSNLLDIVCPWSLFTPAKRDAYLAIVGAPTGQRTPGAGCGTVERDVAGTAAGQWFMNATPQAQMQLNKVGFYGDPMQIILGVDSTVYVGHTGPSNDIRFERSNSTWKDPASLTTSWCYQSYGLSNTPNGWLWLRLNTATQMDVAYSPDGTCPLAFPTTGFMPYYR